MVTDSILQMSPPQKLNQVAIFLPRGKRYVAVDLVSRLEASVLMELAYKLPLVDLEPKYLKRFLKRRRLHFDPDVPLITDGSYYDGRQGMISTLSSDKLKKNASMPYHNVVLHDFLLSSEKHSREKVMESFRNFTAYCPCGRTFQNSCRTPEEWKIFYHDPRESYALPSPANTAVIDRHAFVAIGAASYVYDLHDFGIFTPSSETIEDMRKLVKKQARETRIANYMWEETVEKTSLAEPFITLIREAYGLNLRDMLG